MNKKDILLAVVIGGLFYTLGQYVASEPQRVQKEAGAERTIVVQGEGEVQAVPDVARITLGVQTNVMASAQGAIKSLTGKFTAVVEAVKQGGVDDKDIKTTNLTVRPQYDYRDGRRTLRGFAASESVEITIRDLDKISDVIGKTVMEGVNQVGDISFEIDEPDSLQQEAQELAIKKARENAKQLAKALGVRLGNVKTFTESSQGNNQPVFREAMMAVEDNGVEGPPVEAGSQEVVSKVTITYEIK